MTSIYKSSNNVTAFLHYNYFNFLYFSLFEKSYFKDVPIEKTVLEGKAGTTEKDEHCEQCVI